MCVLQKFVVRSVDFWPKVTVLVDVLSAIDKHIIAAQSDNVKLSHAFEYSKKIAAEIGGLDLPTGWTAPIKTALEDRFKHLKEGVSVSKPPISFAHN